MKNISLSRRRFLTITAAAGTGLFANAASAATWAGFALGAEARITLRGPRVPAEAALDAALAVIRQAEAEFSLYDPHSSLSRLNRVGHLGDPSPMFLGLMAETNRVYQATGGLFDPTVQTLWTPSSGPMPGLGWQHVQQDASRITLGAGQRLTFNGIAQGYATDLVAELLADHGFTDTLVDIGELRGQGGPWRIGLSDPDFGHLGTRVLSTGGLATSSPGAMTLTTGGSHIVDPLAPERSPLWSTVSVEAETAVMADGASTALCFADVDQIRALRPALPGLRRITLVDQNGDLITI